MAAHAAAGNSIHLDETLELLCPDTLPTQRLVALLSQRYFQVENLESLNRQELIRLVNEHVVPRPRRKYKPNRRGLDMSRQQQLADRSKGQAQKRNAVVGPSCLDVRPAKMRSLDGVGCGSSQPNVTATSPKLLGAVTDLLACQSLASPSDVVKPLPPAVNFSRKVIKLSPTGSISKPSSTASSPSVDTEAAAMTAVSVLGQGQKVSDTGGSNCSRAAPAKANSSSRSSQEQIASRATSAATDGKRVFKRAAVTWP